MNFKATLENYLGDLLKSDPRVKEHLDKLMPNDKTIQKILDNQSESNSQEGENEMAKFEKQTSEYISGNDLVGIEGTRFEIVTEVKEESTNFGMKPRCSVKVTKVDGNTSVHTWTLNLQNINYLIDNFGGESNVWIGKSFGVYTENIKGNNAIRVKA